MSKDIATYLSIDNKEIPHFVSIHLTQKFNAHHAFEIIINQDALLQGAHTMQSTRDYIGKFVLVSFGQNSPGDNVFRGLVTDVSLRQGHGRWANLVLKGYGPTYLLEGGQHNASFAGRDLGAIVKELCSNMASNDLNLFVKPAFKGDINYICQYKESNFQFINRLAVEYSEWFYSDGQNLYFGRPSSPDAIKLLYGQHISELDFSLRLAPNKASHYSYNSESDQVYTSESERVSGTNAYMQKALEMTDKLFKETVIQPAVVRTPQQGELEKYSKNIKGKKAAATVVLTATGDNPKVQIGGLVKIIVNEHHFSGQGSEEGEYLVTSIEHFITDTGEYSHRFEAIPSASEYIYSESTKPLAETQVATVISNNDPMGQGRVKVQMLWQAENNETTEWIRVLMPDAGSGDTVSKNRGHVFIPDVGDQVLVGFRYNDPSRPFVMGSVFHGKNGTGGGPENNVKSIKTKSGHTLEFDDTSGGTSITIKDKNGNSIILDTAGKNISISAPETIMLSANNIVLNAKKNISHSAGGSITSNAEKDITLIATGNIMESSDERTEMVEKEYSRQAKKSDEYADEVTVSSAKENLTLQSSKTVNINSGEKSNLF